MGIFANIVTFGAAGRIEDANDSYNCSMREYKQTVSEYEKQLKDLKKLFEPTIQAKKDAIKLLQQSRELFKKLSVKDREILEEKYKTADSYNFTELNEKLSKLEIISNYKNALDYTNFILHGKEYFKLLKAGLEPKKIASVISGTLNSLGVKTAINVASLSARSTTGIACGASVVTGNLALGTTAIATSGMATTGAIGIAATGGVAVSSVIFAPLAIIGAGIFSHLSANKKIEEIESAKYQIYEEMGKVDEHILRLKLYKKRCKEITNSLEKSCVAMMKIFKITKNELRKLGFIGNLFRYFKLKMKKQIYSDKEYELLIKLKTDMSSVLKIVDSPILDVKDTIKAVKK